MRTLYLYAVLKTVRIGSNFHKSLIRSYDLDSVCIPFIVHKQHSNYKTVYTKIFLHYDLTK